MRPIRLELKGFTSFRQRCEINFEALDLFAITGPTGAGKSSLLDAITYVFYGRTSRLGKSGKELISQGSLSMHVLLEFRAGNDAYRVFRGIKGASVNARIEKRAQDGSWQPITSSIRQIDEEIVRIIGLDFEGFTRAVILPQGRFDEFLRGDAKKRKDVLSELLNLSVYRVMMQQANEKARTMNERADWAESHIDSSVSNVSAEELRTNIAALNSSESEIKNGIALLESAQPTAQLLSQYRMQLDEAVRESDGAGKERQDLERQLAFHERAAKDKEDLCNKLSDEIEKLQYDATQHISVTGLVRDAEHQAKVDEQITECKETEHTQQTALHAAESELRAACLMLQKATEVREKSESDLDSAKRELADLTNKYGSTAALVTLKKDLDELNKKVADQAFCRADLEVQREELSSKDEILSRSAAAYREAQAQADQLEQQVEHIRSQHRALDLRRELRLGELCPVCEHAVERLPSVGEIQDLDRTKAEHNKAKKHARQCEEEKLAVTGRFDVLAKKIALQEKGFQELLNSIVVLREKLTNALGGETDENSSQKIDALLRSFEEARERVNHLEKLVRERTRTENESASRRDSAQHKIHLATQQIENVKSQLARLEQERAELADRLKDHPELGVLQHTLRELERTKSRFDTQSSELEKLRKEHEAAKQSVLVLQAQIDATVKRIETLGKSTAELQKNIKASARKLRRLHSLTLPEGTELEALNRNLHLANEQLVDVMTRQERARLNLEAVLKKLEENERLRKEADNIKHSAAVYHELGTLLNLGNFQQYLLGASFSRLAKEGSHYLKDLSGGRYSFSCEQDEFYVRDHWNGDDLRSVSTLSGGESFLASLSLALALAHSIVELSGERGAVALESLFLDEGFSTLDADTLGKVADALPLLQKGGRLIGVITHVQSLADQLPARIEITKGPTGSQIAGSEGHSALATGA